MLALMIAIGAVTFGAAMLIHDARAAGVYIGETTSWQKMKWDFDDLRYRQRCKQFYRFREGAAAQLVQCCSKQKDEEPLCS